MDIRRSFRSFLRNNLPTISLRQNQKVIEFFDRDDINGKLLILGEPGTGKTTELLGLAKDLIERAITNEHAGIPIIFELSSWKSDQSIDDWIVEKLIEIYIVGKQKKVLAKHLIDNYKLIFLLDGLDELGLEQQNKFIVMLNEFLVNRIPQKVVVCCRREEYEQSETQLNKLNGAIYLRPLGDEQIRRYLRDLNCSYIWNENIRNNSELLQLCRKPLFLAMLVIVYRETEVRIFSNSFELFEAYIKRKLRNSNNQDIYSSRQVLRYLVWLARQLEVERKTEFFN